MFGLAVLFVYVFLLSFEHFDHLAWGRGSWTLCLSCICLLAMRTLICATFSLPPGVGGWLRLLLEALPGVSLYLFVNVMLALCGGQKHRPRAATSVDTECYYCTL